MGSSFFFGPMVDSASNHLVKILQSDLEDLSGRMTPKAAALAASEEFAGVDGSVTPVEINLLRAARKIAWINAWDGVAFARLAEGTDYTFPGPGHIFSIISNQVGKTLQVSYCLL